MRTPYSPVHRVLVSGGGVAGPALAFWLCRHGFAPTVVERAAEPRPGGQAVDVRGAALDVVERMGLLPQLRALRTEMTGMSVVDRDGTELMRSTEFALSSGRLDSPDVEVLRDDLTALLLGATRDGVEYRYGDAVTSLEQTDAGVRVGFEHGADETFDLVVGADGLHSAVRRLAFGPEQDCVRHLGAYVGVFTAPNFLGLDRWQTWLRADGVGFAVYTARDNTELRVNLGFESEPLTYDRRDVDAQRRLLASRVRDAGWETAALLEHLWRAPDFYFDAMAQVHLDRWSIGRVTLLGDAGYCPSPLSGQGTSLAVVGAYVLAAELAAAGGDHTVALDAYERRLRPFVAANQALATENPGGPAAEESVAAAARAVDLDGPGGGVPGRVSGPGEPPAARP